MSKVVKAYIKLQIPAGKANPAPPVGPALGQHGVPIQDFCTAFNNETRDKMGDTIPVVITVYEDRSFSFICKTPPASELIRKKINLPKGSGKPNTEKVGEITWDALKEVAQVKMPDLNTTNVEAAASMLAGTAKRMGLKVVGTPE